MRRGRRLPSPRSACPRAERQRSSDPGGESVGESVGTVRQGGDRELQPQITGGGEGGRRGGVRAAPLSILPRCDAERTLDSPLTRGLWSG